MVMMTTVRLMEQKGFEEPEGSSEVTGPVQQGEVRGGFFGRELFFFTAFFLAMFFVLTLFAFLAFSFLVGANGGVGNDY